MHLSNEKGHPKRRRSESLPLPIVERPVVNFGPLRPVDRVPVPGRTLKTLNLELLPTTTVTWAPTPTELGLTIRTGIPYRIARLLLLILIGYRPIRLVETTNAIVFRSLDRRGTLIMNEGVRLGTPETFDGPTEMRTIVKSLLVHLRLWTETSSLH